MAKYTKPNPDKYFLFSFPQYAVLTWMGHYLRCLKLATMLVWKSFHLRQNCCWSSILKLAEDILGSENLFDYNFKSPDYKKNPVRLCVSIGNAALLSSALIWPREERWDWCERELRGRDWRGRVWRAVLRIRDVYPGSGKFLPLRRTRTVD